MSIFVSDYKLVVRSNLPHIGPSAADDQAAARKLHRNPQILDGRIKRPANRPAMLQRMGKVITVQFRRSILPRRLLDDGWWLESKPARAVVVAFPNRRPSDPRPGTPHLTLVKSEK